MGYNSCTSEIEDAQFSLKELRKIIENFVETLNIGDYHELINNLPDKEDKYFSEKKFIYNIDNKIDEIKCSLDDAEYEADDLENEVERLESEVSDYDTSYELFQKSNCNFDTPTTNLEVEFLNLVLEVYNNRYRLNESDQEILRILSRKTL